MRSDDVFFPVRSLARCGITSIQWRAPPPQERHSATARQTILPAVSISGVPVGVKDWVFYADVYVPTSSFAGLWAEVLDAIGIEMPAHIRPRLAQDDTFWRLSGSESHSAWLRGDRSATQLG